MAGKTDSLDPNTTIEVPDDRFGLYSCDILDPDVVGNPITIPWPHNCPLLFLEHYHLMWYQCATDLCLFTPWDLE